MLDSLSQNFELIDDQRQIFKNKNQKATGKFGKVYEGFDKLNNRKVALKQVVNDQQQSWKKEISNMQLFDHPNIVKCYGFIPRKQQKTDAILYIFIMMELVDGHDLHCYIKSNAINGYNGLTQALVHKLFGQLLDGYNHIHSKNFIHRDIKPQNILVDINQNIKIIDFGQSKERTPDQAKGLGTPLYSAPEIINGQNPSDFRRDVWSLGLVLYEMITGHFPFQQWKNTRDIKAFKDHLDKYVFQFKFPNKFSNFWVEICRKMLLHKDYKKRINLHEVIFEFKKREPEFELKFEPIKISSPIPKLLIESALSGNTDPVSQSASEFEINRTKRYLNFYNNKHKFLILLKDHFNKSCYPFISNAHKLILVFVSFNIYIAAIDHLLKRLSQHKIKINDNQQYDANNYEEPYYSRMIYYLNLYRQYYLKESQLTKNFVLEKIIPQFSQFYQKSMNVQTSSVGSSSSSTKKCQIVQPFLLLQEYPEVKLMIQNFIQGINYDKSYYLQKYRNLLLSKDYLQSQVRIRTFLYQQDLLVYLLMLIIANLDEELKWQTPVFEGNVLLKLRQELFSLKRDQKQTQQLISKILALQKKL